MLGWSKVIDQKKFHEIVGDDLGHLDTIIALFDEQSRENVANMRTAIEEIDIRAFERAAHDLKNLGRNIASEKLIAHSQELEQLAGSAQLHAVTERLDETVDLLARALKELQQLRKKW